MLETIGKTVSIYIDDDLLQEMKRKNISPSKAVRTALRKCFEKEAEGKDYDLVEKTLFKTMTAKGRKAWKEILQERDRW